MKFKFLEHTADAKFQAFGKNLEEAFVNAALALTKIMIDSKVKAKITKKIKVSGNDNKSLLYNFLEELLFLLDTKNFLLSKIKEIKIKNNTLTAVLIGDNNLKSYEIKTNIKAITYHEMFIKQENNKFALQVVLDI